MSDHDTHSAWLGVDEDNLGLRRKFIGLGEADRAVLEPLIPWIRQVSANLAEQFYDFQFGFGPTRRFFDDYAQASDRSLDDLRRGLERAQANYIESVFEGASTGWNLDYFERRLQVGLVHDRINLPFKWYVGSYCLWVELLRKALTTRHPNDRRAAPAPGEPATSSDPETDDDGEPETDDDGEEVLRAVEKVFNLDLQAIGDAFLVATLESLGLSISSVTCGPGQDRTEAIGQLKDELQAVANALPALTSSIGSVAASIEELSISSQEISARTAEVFSMSSNAARLADTASQSVQRLNESSERIDGVTSAIAKVADQTNLLALNASIEAARAGEAGSGFAVVSHEVKELARQTAASTSNIEAHIKGIRDQVDEAVTSITAIVESISSVTAAQSSAAAATEEQSTAIAEIGRSAAEASRVAGEINAIIRLNS